MPAFTINVHMQRKGKCERCDYNFTRKLIVNIHSLQNKNIYNEHKNNFCSVKNIKNKKNNVPALGPNKDFYNQNKDLF